jgi:hypothetical protein
MVAMNGLFRRRNLPHWDVEDAPYFITSCLNGSIPEAGMRELAEYNDQLKLRPQPQDISPDEWERRLHKLWFARMDELLDFQPAIRHFERADLAKIVTDSFSHFADVRYLSLAWVVNAQPYSLALSTVAWILRNRCQGKVAARSNPAQLEELYGQ